MLVAFLRDDLHILLSVFVGAYLVVSQVEKRPRLALRLAVCLAVISAWMMLNSFQPAVLFAGFSMFARGSIKYSGLFILNVLAVLFYSRAGFFTALFAATVGYSIQHTCERLWEILRRLELMPVWLDRICLSLVLAAALYLYNRLVLRRSHSDRFTSFDRLDSRILLFIASAVIMGNIVIDLRLISNFQNMTQEGQALFDLTTAMISGLVLVVSMCRVIGLRRRAFGNQAGSGTLNNTGFDCFSIRFCAAFRPVEGTGRPAADQIIVKGTGCGSILTGTCRVRREGAAVFTAVEYVDFNSPVACHFPGQPAAVIDVDDEGAAFAAFDTAG